jgi:hypothetical protein
MTTEKPAANKADCHHLPNSCCGRAREALCLANRWQPSWWFPFRLKKKKFFFAYPGMLLILKHRK